MAETRADARHENPRMREDLEIIPASMDRQQVYVVRDSLGLIEQDLVLNRQGLELLAMLDGKTALRDIEIALTRRRGGLIVRSNEILDALARFDAAFLLNSERFRQARARAIDAFANSDVREPALAGQAYPADPAELGAHLAAMLSSDRTPAAAPAGRVVAVVAPHIDLRAGEQAYAAAYGTLRAALAGTRRDRRPDLAIILGTGHSMSNGTFCLTTKDFSTPLGRVKTNREAVEQLRAAAGNCAATDDMPHRREHSIEFQILFLQHLLGSASFSIVPVLCGSFGPELVRYQSASHVPGIRGFLGALRGLAQSGTCRPLLVAGVDLSHVGPKFGHEQPAKAIVAESGAHDGALIEALCSRDGRGFWTESRRVGDRYHVCGFSALACLIEVLPESTGRLLKYDTSFEGATDSAVSFAAAVFTSR